MAKKGKSVFTQSLYRGPSSVKVVVDNKDLAAFLQENKEVRDLLINTAQSVQAAAESTADDAQKGAGGTLYGYAEAGFTVEWEARGKRPRVIISSNADPEMALRVHFYTQKRDGISHLRKALRDAT